MNSHFHFPIASEGIGTFFRCCFPNADCLVHQREFKQTYFSRDTSVSSGWLAGRRARCVFISRLAERPDNRAQKRCQPNTCQRPLLPDVLGESQASAWRRLQALLFSSKMTYLLWQKNAFSFRNVCRLRAASSKQGVFGGRSEAAGPTPGPGRLEMHQLLVPAGD